MKTKALQYTIKTYQELSRDELYALLQLRAEVFVVEQDCVYQDLDGKDDKALHVLGYKEDRLVAYTRIFPPGAYFEDASIGRVVVQQEERAHKYGYELRDVSNAAVMERFEVSKIKISAQVYLKRFYNTLGFVEVGEGYLEDGIPHIAMVFTVD
jgi:ElaA protein